MQVEATPPREMAVNDGDTSSVAGEDVGVVIATKKAPKKRRRMKSKFARNLKKRSNQKDSSTRRNFDDALTAGFIAPTPDATTQVTSQVAARKLTISQLTKALVQSNNEKTLLLNEVNAKAKEVNDLKKKNSDLAGVVHISRCKVRESRRREKLAEDATLKLERELEVMKTTFDEALMKAVDEVAMKEKVGKVRRCIDQFDVFVDSFFAWKMSQRQQSNQFSLAVGATGNLVAGPPLAAVSETTRPAHPARPVICRGSSAPAPPL